MSQTDLCQEFQNLVEIIAQLRGPEGCPWDIEQTQKSLAQYAIEEAFELAEAIESGQQMAVQEELGDFLFQVILQAQVAKDNGHFELHDVIKLLSEKMVRRHPHVFAGMAVASIEEVWTNWEKLKKAEKKHLLEKPKSYFNLPKGLPALQTAHKIGVKTERFRFDWENPSQVFEKVNEELAEVQEAFEAKDEKALEHEIGDLLFSIAQFARHLGIDPEQSLRIANQRFQGRFAKVVELSELNLEEFANLSIAEKEKLWEKAKKQ